MMSFKYPLFLLILILTPVESRKGTSSGRGQSAARGQVANGGGFNQGNFRPQNNNPSGSFHPNPQQPHNFVPQNTHNINRVPTNSWHGSVPQPKTSSNSFGKALLGGAAGALGAIVIYEGAKAIIRSASDPFPYQGRNYYWDQNYKGDKNQFQCSMPLSQLQAEIKKETSNTTAVVSTTDATSTASNQSVSQTIGNLQFQDGTKPRELTWGCKKGLEVCCGMDCCSAPPTSSQNTSGQSSLAGILFLIFLLLVICGCCCCFIAFKLCRSAFDCILPQNENRKDMTDPRYNDSSPQNYPLNQYPAQQPFAPHYTQQYPPQQGYPSNSYPPHPTY